ncbi:MAG: imidazole glycerol phosphate synthase subunit HisH [Eubacteriales bacterium]
MTGKIGIIDYGMGNLHSVKNAFDYIGADSVITSDKTQLESCALLVLPGVGAFGDAMGNLERCDMIDFIKKQASLKPFLGICLGMQLLFDRSYEFTETRGLGLISGEVIRLTAADSNRAYKTPHMGWNSITPCGDSPLFNGITSGSYVYFVHSFKAVTADRSNLSAYTVYGEEITAAVGCKNIVGTQFHPEKSERTGLSILNNFRRLS